MGYILGYDMTFPSLSEADTALQDYANTGHENPAAVELHLSLNQRPRPSDYAAMFQISRELASLRTVFDMGGNAGNLFYCYEQQLNFRDDLVWTVYDLPAVTASGRALADTRNETRLRFTDDLGSASGCDLLLVSGSLHYFPPLAHIVSNFVEKPRMILINRVPLTDARPVAIIQDVGHYRVACMLYNRAELLDEMSGAGYDLICSWEAAELSLRVPSSPDHDVSAYSGLFFKTR